MGCTDWSYFVPYRPDTSAALEALQADVFRRGEYERPLVDLDTLDQMDFFTADEGYREDVLSGYHMEAIRAFMHRHGIEGLRQRLLDLAASKLTNMDDLRVLMELSESGTSSILDIGSVFSHRKGYGLYPLSAEKQIALWGTDEPNRETIEQWQMRIVSWEEEPLYDRGEGFYVTVYKDGLPDSIFIAGMSGD